MNLQIKMKKNQNGKNYLAITTFFNDRDLILNFDTNIIMRLLDITPNQFDKILLNDKYVNLDLLIIRNDLKKL